ncbi:Phosphatidylethanolamine N-methyltransferase [Modestobacter italicus]|uniref:Phosphatidylethanolamine N-methyltransferase n=1 Tax=Modestobacter italicus (strain DSM 44449 / CECT 9708 / BC 501) TaxID=2732864 RepID=I4EUH8_MODI5|nr:class I SAM-dependent methyltransferase [Modestobacter marinus]CCH87041.1 Phosphatidylethanolamine N-methyltransferase [Modestobacter marinus]
MDETARVRDLYEEQAPYYDRVIAVAERLLFAGGREWACRHAHGDVLEVGVGTGRNLRCLPEGIALSGIELSPAMLARAEERARRLGRTADLRVGDAQRLPFADATFDTVLATLTLCSIPDDVTAVAEMARVLRPGGRLVLLDHVASPSPVVRGVQRLLEPLFLRLAADHLLREPEDAVRRAGLVIEELSRSRAGLVLRLTARRP